MPRTVSALSGAHSSNVQIPVSLVRLEITGAEKRLHDLDVSLFLNPTTAACSLEPGAGLQEFVPAAGLSVPQISASDLDPMAEFTITLSNQDGVWFPIIGDGDYKGAAATVWQGNISLPAGSGPSAATFVGVVTMWAGEIIQIEAGYESAVIRLGPPDLFRMPIPRRTYAAPGFTQLPPPGLRVKWGYSEKIV